MKTSLAAFGRLHHDAIARASARIEFQEALIRFSKLCFPVAHGKFLSLQYTKIIYKFIADARAAARSGKKHILKNIKSNF